MPSNAAVLQMWNNLPDDIVPADSLLSYWKLPIHSLVAIFSWNYVPLVVIWLSGIPLALIIYLL